MDQFYRDQNQPWPTNIFAFDSCIVLKEYPHKHHIDFSGSCHDELVMQWYMGMYISFWLLTSFRF